MAEIQQSSDVTFRLFDWNRLGADGKPRALHIAESLAAIDFSRGPVTPVVPQQLADVPKPSVGAALVRCPYFRIDRYELAGALAVPGRISVWVVLAGHAELEGSGWSRDFRAGETVLVPTASTPFTWRPVRNEEPATLLCACSTE
jgi:mannose-6-phosphate isomerase